MIKKDIVKFYFNSFLITLSAFLGGIVSLAINNIWINSNWDLTYKISWSIMIFTLTLISTLLLLYIVIYSIGKYAKE